MQPQKPDQNNQVPTSATPDPTKIEHLGSQPVVYEAAPLPGERPNIAPQNVPHDNPTPPPPSQQKNSTTQIPQTPQTPKPEIGTQPYQPPSSSAVISITEQRNSAATIFARFKKPLFIGGVVIAAILVIMIMLSVFTGGQKTEENSNDSSSDQDVSDAGSGGDQNQPTSIVDRACFKFNLVSDNLTVQPEDTCFLQAHFGEKGISSFNVYPETKAFTSIDEFTATKKKEYNSNVISEENIKIGGLEAKKIVENVGTSNSQAYVRMYVLTPGKNYTYQQTPITGFEINSYYNDEYSRGATTQAIESWQWK